MIRTLFVDAGGVLYNNVNEETDFLARVADRYGLDRERLTSRATRSAHVYESGRTHVHQVFRQLLGARSRTGGRTAEARWLDRAYMDSVRVYDANFAALREIREEQPELNMVLTNNEAEHWDRLKDQSYGHFGMFDMLCSSWRIQRVKPARSFFVEALRRCGAVAEETLVVDDRSAVLRAGAALGLRTLHVSTSDVLAGRLRSLVPGHPKPTSVQ